VIIAELHWRCGGLSRLLPAASNLVGYLPGPPVSIPGAHAGAWIIELGTWLLCINMNVYRRYTFMNCFGHLAEEIADNAEECIVGYTQIVEYAITNEPSCDR